jgi:hypothetical protein
LKTKLNQKKFINPVDAACRQAQLAWTNVARAPTPKLRPQQVIVLGDPQASLARLFEHLDAQQALTNDG